MIHDPFNFTPDDAATAGDPAGGRAVETTATAADRRRSPRVRHRALITVRPLHDDGAASASGAGATVSVILQDLSITGIGVLHSSSLTMGERYEIPLAREGAEPLSLLATVVRVERLDDDLYSIGLQFNSSAAVVDEGSRQLTGRRALRDG